MQTRKSISVYALIGVFVSLLFIGTTIAKAQPNDYEPTPVRKVLSIPAAAFNEVGYAEDWNIERTGGYLRSIPFGASDANIGHFHAPLILPDGFKIHEIRLYAKNNDTPSVDLRLIRNTPNGEENSEAILASVNVPSLSGPDFIMKKIVLRSPHIVMNEGACYSLSLYLPDQELDDVAFHHAEIVYTGSEW